MMRFVEGLNEVNSRRKTCPYRFSVMAISLSMDSVMANIAKCDQIFLGIRSTMDMLLFMVCLQVPRV